MWQTREFLARLAEILSKDPGSIVVLDELEKASLEVQNSILQMLQEGRLTFQPDPYQRSQTESAFHSIRTHRAIVVATTNAGHHDHLREFQGGGFGFNSELTSAPSTFLNQRQLLQRQLEEEGLLSPPLLSRMNIVARTKVLDNNAVVKLVESVLKNSIQNLRDSWEVNSIALNSKGKLVSFLISKIDGEWRDNRDAFRLIDHYLIGPLSVLKIVDGKKFDKNSHLNISFNLTDDSITYQITASKKSSAKDVNNDCDQVFIQ